MKGVVVAPERNPAVTFKFPFSTRTIRSQSQNKCRFRPQSPLRHAAPYTFLFIIIMAEFIRRHKGVMDLVAITKIPDYLKCGS